MACGGKAPTSPAAGSTTDGGTESHNPCPSPEVLCGSQCVDLATDDAHCGACATTCSGGQHCASNQCRSSNIRHVVLIVQENHTFDSYFGDYCQAPAGSSPTCTHGPACCEAAPAEDPSGSAPIALDDESNFATDRDHDQDCELQEIDDGAMDLFVTGATGASTCLGVGTNCSSPDNFAVADASTVGAYWDLATNNALADRYFQPIAGGTASNNMFFAIAHRQFTDNDLLPDTVGTPCGAKALCMTGTPTTFTGRTTVADLLLDAGKTFTIYADGFAQARAAADAGECEGIPSDCPYDPILHPVAAQGCIYDASDIPFTYYSQFADNAYTKDYSELASDLSTGQLPTFAYVKAREFRNEHPNVSKISDGVAFVTSTIQAIESSAYASDTLILLTWDEGGGFFDHVPPPEFWSPAIPPDDLADDGTPVPRGTRVPFLAVGPFARTGVVSHVVLGHASVVRFLEYNFLGQVGQLGYADTKVNNLGSLLDQTAAGIAIP